MNLDFKIPMSGKVARRLSYLNSIIPVDLDPRIMNHVTRDLLDPAFVKEQLVGNLNHELNARQQEVVQFIADTDYRAVIGSMTDLEICEIVLIGALSSGRDVVILDDQDSVMWEVLLPHFGIEYQTVVDPLQPITAKVIVVKDDKTLMTMKNHARDRVLIFVPHHYDFMVWHNNDDGQRQQHRNKPRLSYTLENLAKEFPYCVMGFYLDLHTPVNRIKYWSTEKRVVAMIDAINSSNRIARALAPDNTNKSQVAGLGLTTVLPSKIGKILNVNVDMLTSRAYFFEEDNEEK
jgi:hypothetical protein